MSKKKPYTTDEIEYLCIFFKNIIKMKGKTYIPVIKDLFGEDLPKEVLDYITDDVPLPLS